MINFRSFFQCNYPKELRQKVLLMKSEICKSELHYLCQIINPKTLFVTLSNLGLVQFSIYLISIFYFVNNGCDSNDFNLE